MNIFVFQNTFVKYTYVSLMNIFYNNKKSKLYFGDHVVDLNGLFYGYGGSNPILRFYDASFSQRNNCCKNT
jgi:hypothetical protein